MAMMKGSMMIDGELDADDDDDGQHAIQQTVYNFPRGLRFPFRFSFSSLSHFPVGPGVRVELRASQD